MSKRGDANFNTHVTSFLSRRGRHSRLRHRVHSTTCLNCGLRGDYLTKVKCPVKPDDRRYSVEEETHE